MASLNTIKGISATAVASIAMIPLAAIAVVATPMRNIGWFFMGEDELVPTLKTIAQGPRDVYRSWFPKVG